MSDCDLIKNNIDYDELITFTQKIVQMDSVFDPLKKEKNEENVANFIAKYLETIGLEVHLDYVTAHRPNVIGIYDTKIPGKTLLFEGHTDVVTAGDMSKWTYDPFGGKIVDNKLYGRGACDTKGNVAAAIFAVKSLIESKTIQKGKIILCIPVDEEGLMIGIKDFIKKGWADHVDGAIICEPEENQLCITQKGAIRLAIHIQGKMAHGAMPLSGINPNWEMAHLIVALETYENSLKKIHGKDLFLGYPSVTPTIVKAPYRGEAQINVIPDDCYITLDIRTIPGQKHEEIIEDIKNIIEQLAKKREKFSATLEKIEERPWTKTDQEDPLVKAVSIAYEKVTHKKPVYNGVPGATDGTFLHALKNIPIITIGAGDRSIPHQVDEYVDINELKQTTQIYACAASYFLNISANESIAPAFGVANSGLRQR